MRILCAGILTDKIKKEIVELYNNVEILSCNKVEHIVDLRLQERDLVELLVFSSAIKSKQDVDLVTKIINDSEGVFSCVKLCVFNQDIDNLQGLIDEVEESVHVQIHFLESVNRNNLTELLNVINAKEIEPSQKVELESVQEKASLGVRGLFFKKFRDNSNKLKNKATPLFDNKLLIKEGIHCVTGHSGAGKSDYVANIGYVMSGEKKRTIIVDLDYVSRGLNLYFPQLTKNNNTEERCKGLIYAMKNHESVFSIATKVNMHLDLIGLSYDVSINDEDIRILRNTESIRDFLLYLKSIYDTVIIEVDLMQLDQYGYLMDHIEYIHLLVENNPYSLYKTSSIINQYADGQSELKVIEGIKYRTQLIISKYNDRVKLNNVRLTKEKCRDALQHMLSDEVEFSNVNTIELRSDHSSRLYSDKSIEATEVAGYNEYLNVLT